MRYAIIVDGIVDHVVTTDTPPADAVLAAPDVIAGDVYDAQAGTFSRPPPVQIPIKELRDSMEMLRADFAYSMARAGLISWDEATEWAAGNAYPAILQAIVDLAPVEDRPKVRFRILASRTVIRSAPEVRALQTAIGLTEEQIDGLFTGTFVAETPDPGTI